MIRQIQVAVSEDQVGKRAGLNKTYWIQSVIWRDLIAIHQITHCQPRLPKVIHPSNNVWARLLALLVRAFGSTLVAHLA